MSVPLGERPGVVLAVGVLVGAGLVQLGSHTASTPPLPPIVMVIKADPPAAPAAPAPVAAPAPMWEPVPPFAAPQPVAASEPAPLPSPEPVAAPAPVKVKASRPMRVRRAPLAQLPNGVVAGLRRSGENSSGAVARELVAGARALERGTAYTAWVHFSRALELERENRDALMGVALCHYELEQKGAATRALARLLALDPTHPEAAILQGFIAQQAGDASAAIDWYERALPRLEDDAVADELRSVITLLRPQVSLSPSATARAGRTKRNRRSSSPKWRSP